mgnify:CR=1 FL=1
MRGSLRAVPAPRNPGEFDARPWLDRQGVVAQLRSRGPIREVEAPPAWRDFGQDLRGLKAFPNMSVRTIDNADHNLTPEPAQKALEEFLRHLARSEAA